MADALKKAEAQDARQVVLNAALEVIPYEAKDWVLPRAYLFRARAEQMRHFLHLRNPTTKDMHRQGIILAIAMNFREKSEEAIKSLSRKQIKHDPQDAGLLQSAFIVPCFVRENIRMR